MAVLVWLLIPVVVTVAAGVLVVVLQHGADDRDSRRSIRAHARYRAALERLYRGGPAERR